MSKKYSVSHYKHIHKAESAHFWFVARNELLRDLVLANIPKPSGKSFVDIGCGTGIMLSVLGKLGFDMTGLDINERALTYAANKTSAKLVRKTIFQYRPGAVFDAVGAFDVLEHVRDDQAFLVRCAELLNKDGLLFLTVPAGQYLWSPVDDLSGHYRRYTRKDLEQRLKIAGFRVCAIGHWNTVLLPAYVLWRMLPSRSTDVIQRYLKIPNPVINTILLGVLRLENALGRGKMPYGATLVTVARKV